MPVPIDERQALDLWRRALIADVRRSAPDLTVRQTAILLTVYLSRPPHTVRGLANALRISKPAVTRAVDRLTALDLVRRRIDERDRRSVLIEGTERGPAYLSELAGLIVAAGREIA